MATGVFEEFRKDFVIWSRDRKFQQVQPTPTGPTPRLLRGAGVRQPKGFMYDKKFERFAVASLTENSGKAHFMLTVPPADLKVEGHMKDIVVMPKIPQKTWENEDAAMMQFAKLQFAFDLDEAKAVFPKVENCFSWKLLLSNSLYRADVPLGL